MEENILTQFAQALLAGSIRVIDLSQSLDAGTAVIQLPPEFGKSWPFRLEEISKIRPSRSCLVLEQFLLRRAHGHAFRCPGALGYGRRLMWIMRPIRSPVEKLIAPACVIDATREAAENPDFLLTRQHVQNWEHAYGRIEAGSWGVDAHRLVETPGRGGVLEYREDGAHVPGPHPDLIPFLTEERDVAGWGSEGVGTDAGQAFRFNSPFPCHSIMHGSNKFGLASLTNLDQLPPKGSLLITPPLKIVNGSGSPCRVLALVAA